MAWIHSGLGGPPALNVWSEIQNVHPPLPSDVASVLSASLREARAYFRQGHIPYDHGDYDIELCHELEQIYRDD